MASAQPRPEEKKGQGFTPGDLLAPEARGRPLGKRANIQVPTGTPAPHLLNRLRLPGEYLDIVEGV